MASTTNNSGINGDPEEEFGPDEKWDDESVEDYLIRMHKKREYKEQVARDLAERQKNQMPPCLG